MEFIKIPATTARKDFFNILNKVVYENAKIVITKAGMPFDVEVVRKEINSEGVIDEAILAIKKLNKTRAFSGFDVRKFRVKDSYMSNLLSGKFDKI